MIPLVHKHLIVRAEVTNPPKDETLAKEFLKELIEGINMKIPVSYTHLTLPTICSV